jgi:hypothetical protein
MAAATAAITPERRHLPPRGLRSQKLERIRKTRRPGDGFLHAGERDAGEGSESERRQESVAQRKAEAGQRAWPRSNISITTRGSSRRCLTSLTQHAGNPGSTLSSEIDVAGIL